MKETFVAMVFDRAGKFITFERFSCVKAETAKNNMLRLFSNDLYRVCTAGAAEVRIFRSGDDTWNGAPVLTFEV